MSWHVCRVVAAGAAENEKIYVKLDSHDDEFTDHRWFTADPTMKREMLATALAAINGDKNVWVELVDTEEYSRVMRLYLLL